MTDSNEGISPEALLQMQGAMGTVTSAFTGMKQQFIDQGWGEDNAEAMVVEMFRMNNNAAQEKLAGGNRAQRRGR